MKLSLVPDTRASSTGRRVIPSSYPAAPGYIRLVTPDARWWIASSEHTVSELISGSPEQVRDFYVDLQNIALVHPLVVSVTPAERQEHDAGYTQRYAITDRIPLGPFAMKIGYTARVDVPRRGDVRTEARQFPHVRLHGTVSFDAVDGGTRLTERLLVTAPRPLASFTVREAVKAHRAMLEGIREYFA